MKVAGFEWDQGNRDKCRKHGLSIALVESIFDQHVTVLPDHAHSETERRFRAIGKTVEGRFAFVVFALRGADQHLLIRPISARYMHQAEVSSYEKAYPHLQNR
jgi:uncharacterized protein